MAAERFFTKIANDVLDASEQIATRMEEGLGVVFGESKTLPQAEIPDFGNDNDEEEELLLMDNPLQGMADDVLRGIMEGQGTGPQTFSDHWNAFLSAVTWTEPFIIGLICFQILMFILSLYVSRKNFALVPRVAVMLVIGIIVRTSEYANIWASSHWKTFATQNYFDHRGIFMSGMVCAPLLVDSLVMLLFFLREAAQLLVQVKTIKMKKTARQKNKSSQKKEQ